jgi:hypothetical protein
MERVVGHAEGGKASGIVVREANSLKEAIPPRMIYQEGHHWQEKQSFPGSGTTRRFHLCDRLVSSCLRCDHGQSIWQAMEEKARKVIAKYSRSSKPIRIDGSGLKIAVFRHKFEIFRRLPTCS